MLFVMCVEQHMREEKSQELSLEKEKMVVHINVGLNYQL